VFDPNEVLADLAMEVSALPANSQIAFRIALVKMAQSIEIQIDQQLNIDFHLSEGDILITQYDNLNNKGFVIEGLVDHDNVQASFRAIIDLAHPEDTLVTLTTGRHSPPTKI